MEIYILHNPAKNPLSLLTKGGNYAILFVSKYSQYVYYQLIVMYARYRQ